MEELIARLIQTAGLDPATAEQAVGIIIGFLEKHAPASAVARLSDAIPGAKDSANAAAADGPRGLAGLFGGLLTQGSGDLTGLGGQLVSAGLHMNQIQTVAHELFAFARAKVDENTVNEILDAVPGLKQFV